MAPVTDPPPEALPGTVQARALDAPRIAAWQVRGWAHGALRGPWRGRVVSAVCLVVSVPTWPLLAALVAVQAHQRSTKLYLDPERTAVVGVTATDAGWRLENHACRHPGSGAGARLRAVVGPALLAAADRARVTLYLDASAPALARRYADELEMEDAGPAPLRGRRMRRPPRVGPSPEDAPEPPDAREGATRGHE